ncbi:hypothetical protein JCM8097_003523 [Rhodosporidiobolus ruineniae]
MSSTIASLGLAAIAALVAGPRAAQAAYSLNHSYAGDSFFSGWDYYGNYDNLTFGDIDWVNQTDSTDLAYVNSAGNAIIKVDNTSTVLYPNKRRSVRLQSQDSGPLPRFLSFEGRQRTLVSSRRSSAGVGAEGGGGKKVAFRELVGQAGAAEYDDDAEEEEEEDEGGETVKPPRRAGSGEGSSAFGSGSGGSGSQASFGAPGSLADLFGLEVPKTRTKAKGLREEGEGEEGLATLFVPGNGGEDGTGRRKGSIVVVKKSQLAALHRRLDEVEALVSSALAASGSPTPSAAGSPVVCRPTVNGGEEDGIEGVVEKVDGLTILPALSLERLTREFLASPTASPVASTADTPASHRSRRSRTRTLSSQYAYADDEDEDGQERELEWPKGWKALSGYVVAASIGIGIVAGEVVLSQVFGMRGRR